jgi:hypothetical protein
MICRDTSCRHALAGRRELLKDTLTPSLERRKLLTLGEQFLVYDLQGATEYVLRLLLGSFSIERLLFCHTYSPSNRAPVGFTNDGESQMIGLPRRLHVRLLE